MAVRYLAGVRKVPGIREGRRYASVRVQRKQLAKFLRESPSLRPEFPELLADAYDKARIEAADETGIDIDTFPETCEWTVPEVLG